MIVTYQLGAAKLSVEGVDADQLGYVLDFLRDTQLDDTGAPGHGGIELTAQQREQIAGLQNDADSLATILSTNGQSSRVIDHLEVVDLDDEDALARVAFNAFAPNNTEYGWDTSTFKENWRAAAAAVRAATLLQQANRAVADA